MTDTDIFTGLSAFPLTPLAEDRVDRGAFGQLVRRLVDAGVDSIGALGSTGSYAYLTREERAQVAGDAVAAAGDVPVIVGIGALRTSHVQALAVDAQQAGAAAVMLAPVTYQALTDDEVYNLYREVTTNLDVPLIVYDNPATTHVTFTTELYGRIAELPHVAAIKIPPLPAQPADASARLAQIRTVVPDDVRIGISGDAAAATALAVGCDLWFSAIAGTLPTSPLRITRGALTRSDASAGVPLAGCREEALQSAQDSALAESARLRPLWDLMAAHGSLRVAAAAAGHLGLVGLDCLPHPVLGLKGPDAEAVAKVVDELDLG